MGRVAFIVGITIVGVAVVRAGAPQAPAPPKGVTLMGLLAPWMYPGARMPSGATISDGGDLVAPQVQRARNEAPRLGMVVDNEDHGRHEALLRIDRACISSCMHSNVQDAGEKGKRRIMPLVEDWCVRLTIPRLPA